MKSRFGLVLMLAAFVAVAGLAIIMSSSTAQAQNDSQQSISAVCLSGQPVVQVTTDDGCKAKSADDGKKKCDPNEGKKADPNCPKK